MEIKTLKTDLAEWSDLPSAMWALALCLGLMTPETDYQVQAKHVFWSDNPVGNMLHDFVERLVQLQILEYRETDDDHEYRWNPAFRGSWEEHLL